MASKYVRNLACARTPAVLYIGRLIPNAAAETLFARIPELRERYRHGLEMVLASKTAHELVLDGTSVVFFPIFNDDDRAEAAAAVQGRLQDLPSILHELEKGSPRFTEILHHTPNIVLTARPNGQIDYLSRRWYEVTDARARTAPEEALEKAMSPGEYRDFSRNWMLGIARGLEFTLPLHLSTVFGRRAFELRARPVRRKTGGIAKWVATLTDVEQTVTVTQGLSRLMHRFEILAKAGSVLGAARTLEDVADGLVQLPVTHRTERWFLELRLPGFTVVRRGLLQRESDVVWKSLLRGVDSVVVEPRENGSSMRFLVSKIVSGDESFGFVGLAREVARKATEEDRRVVSEVANRVAIAVERILSFLRDQELARMLQRSMLPLALPYSPGVRLDVAYEPAEREALVGGDWYDAFELPNGLIAVEIGDVAGHGIEAAIVMNQVRHTVRAAALRDPDPTAVLTSANRVVNSQRQPMVTALFGVLDPLTLTFTFASAGHLPPLLVTENGDVRALRCEGLPLGVAEELSVPTRTETLEPGGALVLYTDGVVEDQHDPIAGERALRDALESWAKVGFLTRAADLQSSLRIGMHHDDAAMFVLQFPHVDEFKIRLPATTFNARRLRLAARRFVSGSPFAGDRAFDAVLAIGEAVNNAIEHPYSDDNGFVTLRLKRETQRLIAEVQDEGSWRERESVNRGRGLGIIRHLADKVEIRKTDGGTTVHIELAYVPAERETPVATSA
jgi:anti-sigma regulatory factor (Ser/Thr protein kinase)/PAS domain-containing protein